MSEGRKFRFRFWTKFSMWIGAIGCIISMGVMELTTINPFYGLAIAIPSLLLIFGGMNWLDVLKVVDNLQNDEYADYLEDDFEED